MGFRNPAQHTKPPQEPFAKSDSSTLWRNLFCLRQGNRKFAFLLRCAHQINVIEQFVVVVFAINFVNSGVKRKDQLQTSGADFLGSRASDFFQLCSTFRCCGFCLTESVIHLPLNVILKTRVNKKSEKTSP